MIAALEGRQHRRRGDRVDAHDEDDEQDNDEDEEERQREQPPDHKIRMRFGGQ